VTLSLSQISTVAAGLEDDLRAYAAAGFDGIGVWEMKLDDDGALDAVRASGLRVTNCVPLVPSILPNAVVEGPDDVDERVESMCESVRRLAALEPDCVLCLTGPAGDLDELDAREVVVAGLRRVATAAAEAGVRLGLEPVHRSQREQLSLIWTIPQALELLHEARLPDVGLMVDLWHLGDTADVERHLAANVGRITGVHVAEHVPGRDERELPGARCAELMQVLHQAGWRGGWDVEIFGDPDQPDSLWALPVDEAARRAYAAVTAVAPPG
jgi:sugar phosphate isomerase/epimerase